MKLGQKSQTNWKYILIILILAAVAGGGILAYQYWWLPKHETNPPGINIKNETAGFTPSEVEGWQTYRNDEYGFEVKYPNDATIEDIRSGADAEDSLDKAEYLIDIALQGKTSGKFSRVWVIHDINAWPCYIQGVTVNINGVEFQKTTDKYPGLQTTGKIIQYYTIRKNKCFFLDFTVLYSKSTPDPKRQIKEEEILNISGQILSTFKFID